ncbi:RNA ligase [Streptomyces sp. NPDC017448]|uniref:RNA ligase n=1 Tax=Streptomyces sp. NPDC017448 TaxID=3364996 RepID=UPI00379C72D9
MNLFDLMPEKSLEDEVRSGYVRASAHPDLNLRVLCYTEKAVFEQRWNAVTTQCRGLVIDDTNWVVARCLPKFFNAQEHVAGRAYAEPLPMGQPLQVFRKVDGSLGNVFWYDGKWRVTTKGGFQSDQARWAQRWLDNADLTNLPQEHTYVTEIIYPENRIVVDNGNLRTLTLLAVIGPDGVERSLQQYGPAWERIGGTVVQEFPQAKISRLMFFAQRNKTLTGADISGTEGEGYVVRFSTGLRVKVKFTDYVRLHGIITGLSDKKVWELLREGRSLDSLFASLPDEYHDWVLDVADDLRHSFVTQAWETLHDLNRFATNPNRSDFTRRIQQSEQKKEIARLYNVLADLTWDAVKPAGNRAWKDVQQ